MKKFKEFWDKNFGNKAIVIGIIIFVLMIIFVVIAPKSSSDNNDISYDDYLEETYSDDDDEYAEDETEEDEEEYATVKVPNFKKMSKKKAKKWCKKHNVIFEKDKEYSNKVPKGKFIEQSEEPGTMIEEYDTITITYSKGRKPSVEEENALITGQEYADDMHMSKNRIYKQLTSEYGEGFSAKAAQYAINNIKCNYKKNALITAKEYQKDMHMSRQRIYKQLTSEYGEGFTASEAQYAINHLAQ